MYRRGWYHPRRNTMLTSSMIAPAWRAAPVPKVPLLPGHGSNA